MPALVPGLWITCHVHKLWLVHYGLFRIPNILCYTFTMPRRAANDNIGKHGPTAAVIMPKDLVNVPIDPALNALAHSYPSDENGQRYDLAAAQEHAPKGPPTDGSRSNRVPSPPMLNIIPASLTASSPASPDEFAKKTGLAADSIQELLAHAPRLSGNEDADQKTLFQLYLALKEHRSAYEVGRLAGISVEVVEFMARKYQWDRQVHAIEDSDVLDVMDETNLHDLILLEMQTISGLQGIMNRHTAASAELLGIKELPPVQTKEEREERKADIKFQTDQTLSPTMLMNVAEQLMTLKKAKIGQRKRKPGRMFIVIDPAKAEQLKKDFEARPIAPDTSESPF
jgi:hypothetical protein